MAAWYQVSVGEALEQLRTSSAELTSTEARARLASHGPNALAEGGRRGALGILLRQFTDFMILLLRHGDALIKVTTTICGTDVLKGEYAVPSGRIVGHEPVGVLAALGAGV